MLTVKLNKPQLRLLNEPQQLLAEINIQPDSNGQGSSSSVNIIIVIDSSGSMHGVRIGMVKQAIKQILPMLRSGDSVSIISFKDYATILCQSLTLENVLEIEAKVDSITAGGGTELNTGLKKALEISEPGERTIIVVFSDGESSTPNLDLDMADMAGREEIPIYAAGIGADGTEGQKILSGIAQRSHGISEFLETADSVHPFLSHCFSSAQSPTWKHTTVEIRAEGDTEIIDFCQVHPVIDPKKLSSPTGVHRAVIGNISKEEPYTAIVKFLIRAKAKPGSYLIGKLNASYSQGTAQKTAEAEVKVNISESCPVYPPSEIDRNYLRVEAKRAEQRGQMATTKRLYDAIGDTELSGLASKIISGQASNTEKNRYESQSTRRTRRNAVGGKQS